MTDKAAGAKADAGKELSKEEQAAQEAAAREEAKKSSVVWQETNKYKKPIMGGMAKEFAQQAFTTKDGKQLQLYPQDQDDSEGSGSQEELPDGTIIKKKKKEKKRKRGDKYSKYAIKETNEKNIDMRDLYTEDPSK